jgi:quinol monooxygenase YgiN
MSDDDAVASGDVSASDAAEPGDAARSTPSAMPEVELVVVTMSFQARDLPAFAAVVSKYVVLTRPEPGCRNVDLCASMTRPDRVLVISKWESPALQEAHVAGEVFVDFGHSCTGLLAAPPDIDLWDAPSAHDLR